MDRTTILAVDLGKFNSVLVWYDADTRAAAFRTGCGTVPTPDALDWAPRRIPVTGRCHRRDHHSGRPSRTRTG